MIQKGKFYFLSSCCCHNTNLYCQVFHIICFIRRHLKRHLLLAFCKKLSAIYFQFKLLSRRGQVRDPRHQRGAKRLQDGHLQQDQERHEACRQVERNNNNKILNNPSFRLSQVTEKVAFSIVFNDDCNMPPVDLASHPYIPSRTLA